MKNFLWRNIRYWQILFQCRHSIKYWLFVHLVIYVYIIGYWHKNISYLDFHRNYFLISLHWIDIIWVVYQIWYPLELTTEAKSSLIKLNFWSKFPLEENIMYFWWIESISEDLPAFGLTCIYKILNFQAPSHHLPYKIEICQENDLITRHILEK